MAAQHGGGPRAGKVLAAISHAFGLLPIACGAACRAPEIRRRWGCDAPASSGRPDVPGAFFLPCWTCRGAAERCSTCADPATGKPRGRVWFDRCPSALWAPWVGEVVASLTHYRAGFLPVSGGMQDQARPWVQALRVALPHLAECEHAAAERDAKRPPRG